MKWTDERVELLKKLWIDGMSVSRIAVELDGISRNSVIGKVHRLGLSGRRRAAAAPRKRPALGRPAGGLRRQRAPVAPKPKKPPKAALWKPGRLLHSLGFRSAWR
jgi:GcrA cell cycle regulator